MDNQERDKTVVPYIVYEGERARDERHIKRLWVALLIVIFLLFISNALWLWRDMAFDYADYEVTADEGANANFIGGDMDGDITNGSTDKS